MIAMTINKGLKRTTVLMYDNIDQLEIQDFVRANKYWMLHDNLGSTFEEIDNNHLRNLFLIIDDKKKLIKELKNLRILIHDIINELNVQHLSFAMLIHSINGKEIGDRSEDGLKQVLARLSKAGLTQEVLKKKLKAYDIKYMTN